VVADLNHDGHLDIATSDYSSNSASILFGNGDGTFRPAVHYNTHGNSQGIAVGDFTGSGRLDLAVSNYTPSNVAILLNNGDGTFRDGGTLACGSTPEFDAVADLRGNGKLDIITANYGGRSVSVLLGNGNGTFQAHQDYAVNGNAESLVVGDFDEDGKLDIAVATTNGVSILKGNGDGTFQAPVSINTGELQYVAAADLTGDGHLDLAIANVSTNRVGVLLGNGDGTFQNPVYYPTNAVPHSIVIGDFDGDGTPDLAVSTQGGNTADVFLGRGDGTFRDALHFATGSGPNSIVAGDFANNGRLDLATANFFGSTVSVLLNDGAWPQFGTFALSGPAQATAGDTVPLTVTARRNGAVDTGYTGTVHFTSSDAQAGLPADYTFTAADQGQHTFDFVLRTAGNRTVTAVDAAGGFTGTFTVTVSPAAASAFALTGLPGSVSAGSFQFFTVRSVDAYGNPATDYTGTVTFTSSDPQAALPGDYPFTAADRGSHVFALVLRTAGAQSVTATDTSGPTVTGTQGGVTVLPGAASTFLVAGFPDIVAGQTGTFTVTAEDAFGNLATGYSGTVRLTSSDSRATLSGNYTFTAADRGTHTFGAVLVTAGAQSLTATDATNPAVSGTQGDIVVAPAAVRGLRLSGSPSPAVAGSPWTFTVTAVDAYGNTVPTYAGTVHLTSSDPQATLPSDYLFRASDQGTHTFGAVLFTAGSQALTATDDANALSGGDSGITVLAAGASFLRVDGLPASAAAGEPVTFTVTLLDAYGNVATGYTGTVRFSCTDRRALLPAAYTFTAQDGGSHTFAAVFRAPGRIRLTAADRASRDLQDTMTIRITP
jgi:hypothetical protein